MALDDPERLPPETITQPMTELLAELSRRPSREQYAIVVAELDAALKEAQRANREIERLLTRF